MAPIVEVTSLFTMYRRGRLQRRSFRPPKRKYQLVRPSFNFTPTRDGAFIAIVPPAAVTGVRKVKNFKVTFNTEVYENQVPFWFALVYVPKGYQPNQLYPEGVNDLYSPSNNVILWGLFDPTDATQQTFYSRLSRNLQEGDGIAFVYRLVEDGNGRRIDAVAEYAISF